MAKRFFESTRKILGEHGYHLLFASSLFALASLSVWWSVFIMTAIGERHENALRELGIEARMLAAIIGHSSETPPVGRLESKGGLEIRKGGTPREGDYVLNPNWPDFTIGISQEKSEAIEKKFRRQKVMLIGEGSLLFLLILVSMAMLYRLVAIEHRYRGEMDRFLDLVTHELKTPLAGVRSLLQTIALSRVPCDDMPRVTGLGMKNIERLDHLVQNILVRNRLRHKRFVMQNELIDLSDFARGVIETRVESGQPGQKPILEASPGAHVTADRESLRVILDNLLDNAEKYGQSGRPVQVTVQADGGAVFLRVEDRGQGIAPENLEKIFNPFFRVQSKDDTRKRGSGLGLAICRDLAHRMGGGLTAKSEGLGKGAQFEMRLPRTQAE